MHNFEVIYAHGVTLRFVLLFYLSAYVGDLYTISETPCELRGYKINVIASCVDGVKLLY